MERKPYVKQDRGKIVECLKAGMMPKDAAAALNASLKYVQAIAREEGLSFFWLKQKRDKYREYKALGFSLQETANHFAVGVSEVQLACAGMSKKQTTPWNKGKHTGNQFTKNQYTNESYDRAKRIREHLEAISPNFEYVSDDGNADGRITVRCLRCGNIFERSLVTVRHHNMIRCDRCVDLIAMRRETEKEIDKEVVARSKYYEKLYKVKNNNSEHKCPVCGKLTTRRKYCSIDCCRKAQKKNVSIETKRKHNSLHDAKRRIRIASQIIDKDITLEKLFERDGGICWICGGKCDWNDYTRKGTAFVAGDMYPSRDHVVELSKGGEHSWANIKLAHKRCNTERYWSPKGA